MLVLSLVLVFSILPTLTAKDPFDTMQGYSVLWLAVLFVIGTYLKKYFGTFTFSNGTGITAFAGCVLVTAIGVGLSAVKPSFDGMRLIEYTSPTIVLAAIAVVLLFASLTVPASVRKISKFCVPATFGIYLLHEHPLVRQYIITDKFLPVLSMPAVLQIIVVLVSTFLIWVVCLALEHIRKSVFRLFEVDQMLRNIECKLTNRKNR